MTKGKDYKVVPADQIKVPRRKSPMHIIMDSVDGDFWSTQQVADHIGVHIETIRRVTKKVNDDGTPFLKAPTSAVRSGEVVIYLFTMDDVQEIENHFDEHGYVVDRRVDPKKPLAEQLP